MSEALATMSAKTAQLEWAETRWKGTGMRDAGARRWWTAPVNTVGTVLWRLPGALLGVIMFVAAGSILGPPGLLLALIWLLTGALTGFRFGERVLARTVLRYRPAPGSWLEAEVRRRLPGRRVEVYVAPKAVGVFALGGYTVGLGEASVGSGAPTPALLAATAAAAGELCAGRTRPELPLLWWGVPWWFARQIPGHLLPRRLQPLLRVWAVGVVAAAIVNAVQVEHPSVIVLTGLAFADLWIRGIRGRRQRLQLRPFHPQLQPPRSRSTHYAVPSPGRLGRLRDRAAT